MSPADPNPHNSPSPTSVSVMAARRRQPAGGAGQGASAPVANVNGKDPAEAAERAVKKSRTEPQEAQGIPLCGGVGREVGAGDGGRGTSGCAGDGCSGGARGRKASGVGDRDDYSAVDGRVGAELAGAPPHASVESRKAVRGVGDSEGTGGAVGVVLPLPHLSLSAFSHSQHLFFYTHTNFGNYESTLRNIRLQRMQRMQRQTMRGHERCSRYWG
jgi:hypothetical protein